VITVKILGGLGNQLCVYALGYSLSKLRNEELVLDVSDYDNGYARPYALDAFNLPVYKKLTYKQTNLYRLKPENLPVQLKNSYDCIIEENNTLQNLDDVNKMLGDAKNSYIIGYWLNKKFFDGYQDEIENIFSVPMFVSPRMHSFSQLIKNQTSVAIHIRRTDYVGLGLTSDSCFYKAAIAYIQSIHSDAVFYFFSDDIQFAKNEFGDYINFYYIQTFGWRDADIDEFLFLSMCNHRILSAGSSYGEWAVRLNKNHNSIDVVAQSDVDYGVYKTTENKKRIVFNKQDIEKWKLLYNETKKTIRKNETMTILENKVINYIEKNENEEAIKLLNDISFDAYQINDKTYNRFLSYYGVASAQGLDYLTAEQCFYRQKQFLQGDADFHYNYFLTLDLMGKGTESAVQAGMAAKINNTHAMLDELRLHFNGNSSLLHIFETVVNITKKHFIICPLVQWTYFLCEIYSLSVILAMMGHKVDIIIPIKHNPILTNNIDELVNASINSKKDLDAVYSYGITGYLSYPVNINGSVLSYAPNLIGKLALQNNEFDTIVITRHPESIIKSSFVKSIFLDSAQTDPEYNAFINDKEKYINRMVSNTDLSIFHDFALYNKYKNSSVKDKCRLFQSSFSAPNENEYKFIESKYNLTPNFINDPVLFELAVYILGLC
jgi:hypothetical protein